MIKNFLEFTEDLLVRESMVVEPQIYYAMFNLENDGIKPGLDANGYQTLLDGQRRVAWVDGSSDQDKYVNKIKGLGLDVIKLYDINDDIAKAKIEELSGNGWGKEGATNLVDNEYIAYLPEYEDQAKLAYEELRRRGGWWNVTEPEADIYLARLMGYGEEYIVPYIRKYHPNFDVESYIEENPRNKTIK